MTTGRKQQQQHDETEDGLEMDKAEEGNRRGVPYTVSIAVCSSMVDNAQSLELATMLAGQVARCAGIFCADEVVVVDDYGQKEEGDKTVSSCAAFLARVLQYMETPQYLRRSLVPQHPHLKHVGLLPPLNAPHHPRSTEWTKYREGVVVERASTSDGGEGFSLVNVGLEKPVKVHKVLPANQRVTVRLKDKGFEEAEKAGGDHYRGKVVSSLEPRSRKGSFWGYSVRLARGLREALHGGPWDYDLKIGTSERGEVFDPSRTDLPGFRHLLVVFGAVDGLEFALRNDRRGIEATAEGGDPSGLFDLYLNTCPAQGTRTIRAEEAMVISMSLLSTKFPKFFDKDAANATVPPQA
uniref:RNA methyltransferase n=2 Tax=Chloropicon primus TaxID=1764295 RepID=A0A7S2T2A5_9CHLO|mmetsp:Transcript_4331/g.12733  ORF Transcript_4331/g.12733 Transcript_4331/m.12733 type:complete len:352 (+) Transcript_4331:301-1356(+)